MLCKISCAVKMIDCHCWLISVHSCMLLRNPTCPASILHAFGIETQEMASSIGLVLPEPLQDSDTRSWFKEFEVCNAAKYWDVIKKATANAFVWPSMGHL